MMKMMIFNSKSSHTNMSSSQLTFCITTFRLLFLQIFIPMAQNELTKFKEYYNNFPRAKDKRSLLPTGCCANYCYRNPVEEFGGVQGLCPVPEAMLKEITEMDYPEASSLWTFTPDWFSEKVDLVMDSLGFSYDTLLMDNVWDVFQQVYAQLQLIDWAGTHFEDYFL